MTTSLKFYTDATLATELTELVIDQLADGSTGDVDKVVYLGSTVAVGQFQATSNAGVDDITASIVDASPASGVEASDIKLALSLGGLDSAIAGDPLDLGVTLLGGVANATEIFIRSATPVIASTNTDITIETNEVIETAV